MIMAAVATTQAFVSAASNVSGLVQKAKSFINPGAVRDEHRQARAEWMGDAAVEGGSILAARICYAAPDNVAGNEDGYWTDQQNRIRSARADVWEKAVARGKFWPVGAPFDMPDQRAEILAEINANNAQAPTGAIPTDGGPQGEVVTVQPGPVATSAVNNAANSAGYQLIPTKVVVGLLVGGALLWFLRRKRG